MIQEDYVSFETAKLLKEKGFDEECEFYYNKTRDISFRELNVNSELKPCRYSKPTLQMAMKWLREVQKIYIDIDASVVYVNEDGEIKFDRPNYTWDIICLENGETLAYSELATNYDSYEQALEAAIVYSLENLI